MIQFDETFENVLRNGDRETCARYRNCIIDEQRRRNECKNNAVQIGNILDSQYKEIARTKRFHVTSAVLSLVGVIAVLSVVLNKSAQGHAGLKVFAIILIVSNGYLFLRHLSRSFLLSAIQKETEATVVYVTRIPRLNPDFPESFRTIPADSDEILRSKKQMLDELLGF